MAPIPMREHALRLAARGFRVFKLEVFGKVPAVENWPESASCDAETVRAMWTLPWGEALDNNVGVLAGGDLMVIDVDMKNGAHGDASLDYLVDSLELDVRTFTVKTPTGGRHIYFRTGAEVRNSVRSLGDGLDVRGWHGFVVGPGSETWQGRYEIVADKPIAMAPDWLVGMCGQARRYGDKSGAEPCPGAGTIALDAQADLARAVKWLVDEAPQAVMGAGGDWATYRVAAKLGDYGVSEGMALGLMLEHWNERKAFPPWEVAPLETKVGNAYRYRQRALGVASPLIEFDAVEIAPDPVRDKSLRLIGFDELRSSLDEEYLVEELIPRRGMVVLWSPPKAGKSALALDLALCIATGRPWHGRSVEKGATVYVAAEAADDTIRRKEAWEKTFMADRGAAEPAPPFYLVDCQLDLAKQAKALIEAIETTLGPNGKRWLRLIVLDTMIKTMRGSISDDEMVNAYLKTAALLRSRFGCATLVLHHCGWNETRLKGASSIMADLDVELALTLNKPVVTVRVGESRSDDIKGEMLHWKVEKVDLQPSSKGKKRAAYVVIPVNRKANEADNDFGPVEYTDGENQMFAFFEALENQDGISTADWDSHAQEEWKEMKHAKKRLGLNPSAPLISKVRLRALRLSLLRKGRVRKDEHDQWFRNSA